MEKKGKKGNYFGKNIYFCIVKDSERAVVWDHKIGGGQRNLRGGQP